jgi:type II secretory pathway component PulF
VIEGLALAKHARVWRSSRRQAPTANQPRRAWPAHVVEKAKQSNSGKPREKQAYLSSLHVLLSQQALLVSQALPLEQSFVLLLLHPVF